MKIAKRLHILTIPVFFALLTSCASTVNPYQEFYTGTSSIDQLSDPRFEIVSNSEPEVVNMSGGDIEEITYSYFQEKYFTLGFSSFNGVYTDYNLAKEQAKQVGASIVLYFSKSTGSQNYQTSSVVPSWSSTSGSIGNPNILGGSIPINSSNVTYNTIPVTGSYQTYDQFAYYLVKLTPTKLYNGVGVQLDSLSDTEKLEKKLDFGVKVVGVWNDSKAQRAGLIKGDVIQKVGENKVYTVQEALDLISKSAVEKKPLSIELLRQDGRRLARVIDQ